MAKGESTMFNVAQKFKEKLAEVMADYPAIPWREQLATARDWTIQACHDEIGNAISVATDDLGSFFAPNLTKGQKTVYLVQSEDIESTMWMNASYELVPFLTNGPYEAEGQNLNDVPAEIQGKTILVWSWDDAPMELKRHVSHGGDEDWVALVPKDYGTVSWIDYNGNSFGDTRFFKLPDGRTVYSGAHA
jgi:hypothetical protein